jgi:hypothetical protein
LTLYSRSADLAGSLLAVDDIDTARGDLIARGLIKPEDLHQNFPPH